MSDTKDERETSSPLKDVRESSTQPIREPPLFLPTTSPSFSPFDFETVGTSTTTTKRPRYNTPPPHQWKQQSPMGFQNPESSPSPSNPQAQLTSPDTSSSPSLSPIPSSSSAQETTTNQEQQQQQLRKGKYVSPVWKPNEMLWLAKAWRIQYQGAGSGLGPGPGPGPGPGFGTEGGGRGKTRAEKDREVAEYLNKHGVKRDAKTAGTKWDNMLGEFRKVYEWERGSEREQVGKSYFRLSPYERKIHRLPASFDEEVFEELSQFMGPRMRFSHSSSSAHHHQSLRSLPTSSDLNLKSLLPPPPFREDDFTLSERTRPMQSYMMHNPRNALLGLDPHTSPEIAISPVHMTASGSRAELRRIGRMRMTWEESVSLWAEEGEYHRGRVKVQGSTLLNADELIYFDELMVASTLEAFEDGPFKGFSVDRFVPGQQLKVFGRRKPSSSISNPLPSSGLNERIHFSTPEPSSRWEFQDPTEYYMGCLRMPPSTLPNLFELSWYIQEPPPQEFRLPLRKDVYRDLPQGRELFFTTCSNEPLLDCKSFTIDVLSSVIRSIPCISASTSTSRDSFIGLWDDSINRVISKFCPLEMVFIRKQPKSSSSSSSSHSESLEDQWPHLTGMVKNLCLWRGEEIDQIRESRPLDPSSTITQKISWTYIDLPYVLGYYAIGYNVTFCALSQSNSSPQDSQIITRTDLYTLDLSNPLERLKSLVLCWRIGILLASLAEKCSKSGYHCQSDFDLQTIGVGETIEMTPNTVTKFYPNKRRWQSVKEIHSMLDQRVPHAEHVTCYNVDELSLVFKPRGVKTKPKNTQQLVLALKQVTKALVALHDLSFMHRDLCWDKVPMMWKSEKVEDTDESWYVTGFEEAVRAPQINPHAPTASEEESEKHAPEMKKGVHGVKVDVWGIGYLIKTSGLIIRSTAGVASEGGKQLRELEMKCMEQNPELRPTAADCYRHLVQIQSSLSSAAAAAAAAAGAAAVARCC